MSNVRLKQPMIDHNIKHLKLQPIPKTTILSGEEYPRLPEQNSIELKKNTDDIIETSVTLHTPRKQKAMNNNSETAR